MGTPAGCESRWPGFFEFFARHALVGSWDVEVDLACWLAMLGGFLDILLDFLIYLEIY